MSNPMLSRLSEQEYLQGELTSEIRHEYVDGEIYAMAGAGEAHNLIAGNIFVKLRDFARGGPCRVFISDMKLHVQTWKAYYYPDIMVTCDPNGLGKDVIPDDETCHARFPLPNPLGETTSHSTRLQTTAAKSLVIPQAGEGANESLREFHVNDSQSHFKERPSLVVEVLSPGTESTDRREKMLAYRTIPALREYLLVAADKRQVELYRRDEQDEWQLAAVSQDEPLLLESFGASLTLDEIYEDVRLDVPPVSQ